jgi:hypothetical protein
MKRIKNRNILDAKWAPHRQRHWSSEWPSSLEATYPRFLTSTPTTAEAAVNKLWPITPKSNTASTAAASSKTSSITSSFLVLISNLLVLICKSHVNLSWSRTSQLADLGCVGSAAVDQDLLTPSSGKCHVAVDERSRISPEMGFSEGDQTTRAS